MTREDVELVADFIRIQLEKVEPGAHTVLCGGVSAPILGLHGAVQPELTILIVASQYRRGKDRSNDLDMVITYPHEDGKERGVLRHLIHRLKVKGAFLGLCTGSFSPFKVGMRTAAAHRFTTTE